MGRIFISYRRDDADADSNALYQSLRTAFGPEALYKDVTDIPLAVNWRRAVVEAVEASAIVLCLMGPRWTASEAVTLELGSALRAGVPVLPLLVRGAEMRLLAEELPAELAELSDLNAVELRHGAWDHDLAPVLDLVRSLPGWGGSPTAVERPVSRSASEWASEGVHLVRSARTEEAITAFQRSLDLRPDHVDVLSNLGFALNRVGRSHEALTVLDRAVQLDRQHDQALENRAAVLHALGRERDARQDQRLARRARRHPISGLEVLIVLGVAAGAVVAAAAAGQGVFVLPTLIVLAGWYLGRRRM